LLEIAAARLGHLRGEPHDIADTAMQTERARAISQLPLWER
jgi:hypothetical protein